VAAATGILPLDYMLSVMRNPNANDKRRDAMAMAAAPYLRPKLSPVDAKLGASASQSDGARTIQVVFIDPKRKRAPDRPAPDPDLIQLKAIAGPIGGPRLPAGFLAGRDERDGSGGDH
jgi:hypothetical protein